MTQPRLFTLCVPRIAFGQGGGDQFRGRCPFGVLLRGWGHSRVGVAVGRPSRPGTTPATRSIWTNGSHTCHFAQSSAPIGIKPIAATDAILRPTFADMVRARINMIQPSSRFCMDFANGQCSVDGISCPNMLHVALRTSSDMWGDYVVGVQRLFDACIANAWGGYGAGVAACFVDSRPGLTWRDNLHDSNVVTQCQCSVVRQQLHRDHFHVGRAVCQMVLHNGRHGWGWHHIIPHRTHLQLICLIARDLVTISQSILATMQCVSLSCSSAAFAYAVRNATVHHQSAVGGPFVYTVVWGHVFDMAVFCAGVVDDDGGSCIWDGIPMATFVAANPSYFPTGCLKKPGWGVGGQLLSDLRRRLGRWFLLVRLLAWQVDRHMGGNLISCITMGAFWSECVLGLGLFICFVPMAVGLRALLPIHCRTDGLPSDIVWIPLRALG